MDYSAIFEMNRTKPRTPRRRWIYTVGWGLFAFLILGRCVPVEEENLSDISLSWQDPIQQRIYDFRDKHLTDSLVRYFAHPDATYRYLSAISFASTEDSSALDGLVGLLEDPVDSVRRAAVIALGQIGSRRAEQPLIRAFRADDSLGHYDVTNRQILESIGKVGGKESLHNIATVKSYLPTDTLLLEGQGWAIYRYALRGLTDKEGTKRMIQFLKTSVYPPAMQWIAAHYLYRAKGIDLSGFTSNLIRAFKGQDDPEVKMNLALALGKTKQESARLVLTKALDTQKDYRVRCNIIRALGNFSPEVCGPVVFRFLKDQNTHVAHTAADFIVDHGVPDNATDYKDWARDTSYRPYVRARLFAAAARHLPFYYVLTFGGIRYRLMRWFGEEKDPYVRAQIIRAMSEDPKNYPVIAEKGIGDEHYTVRTASAAALKKIFESDKFEQVYAGYARYHRKVLLQSIHRALKTKDVGILAELAPVFLSDKYDANQAPEEWTYLDTIKRSLPLPRAIETYNVLSKVTAQLHHTPYQPKKPDYNHPMNWEAFHALSDTLFARMNTEKGPILVRLFKKEAPATVVNFVQLAQDKFFDGKSFHRVVPNFVVQDGCNRGDGYGALDYTIRSEFEAAYYHKAGVIGMASAGKDTECTQWFITHAPVPFLDGRYTVFGEVTDGMDVLHSLQVGDVIKGIEIVKHP